ncbi:DJ-1 family protein [Helicobacter sp. 13S00401-1]|uniref:DJ-1 family glyoxalase III n=1 Tax=Helicobacter sp. 13S00401-1 TaxID=1905758 RepID=UPI000BA64935|nr:DJ-1 family glyoxalase III [Helicobacter sp. 13S00401-1]PAF51382.1 DJ-1 family protein [Helicobacter sp. 13S00401-1]
MKTVLVPLATGFEEIEFMGIADTLKRAGVNVIIAGLNGANVVVGANGIGVKAEVSLDDVNVDSLDAIALPGGWDGMDNLKKDSRILKIIQTLNEKQKLVSAVCASPLVLEEAKVLPDNYTCYPGCEDPITHGQRQDKPVVVSGNVITSAGPATAILFGLEIVKHLVGGEKYMEVKEGLLIPMITHH